MEDMGASDVEVEGIDESRVVSINGAEGSSQPGPLGFIIMWDIFSSVVKEGISGQPHVTNQVRADVHSENSGKGSSLSPQVQAVDDKTQSDVSNDNFWQELIGEKFIGDKEMAGEASSRATSGSDEQVEGPAEDQDGEHGEESESVFTNSVLELKVGLAAGSGVLGRDVGLTFIDVVSSGVVDVVTVLPGEIGDEIEGVEDVAQEVIGPLLVGESAVTAFVT